LSGINFNHNNFNPAAFLGGWIIVKIFYCGVAEEEEELPLPPLPNNDHNAKITIKTPEITLLHIAELRPENARTNGDNKIQSPKTKTAQLINFINIF